MMVLPLLLAGIGGAGAVSYFTGGGGGAVQRLSGWMDAFLPMF